MLEATAIYTGDIGKTAYSCGCLWLFFDGNVGPHNHKWLNQCPTHAAQTRPVDSLGQACTCLNVGHDDGPTTCWQHHHCPTSDCTHQDNDDDFEPSEAYDD